MVLEFQVLGSAGDMLTVAKSKPQNIEHRIRRERIEGMNCCLFEIG